MKITILGSGTSGGVPMIACNCDVCSSNDQRDKRLRSSILITINNKNFAVDAGPDFRQQMLTAKVKKLHAIVFTHQHRDHTAGLDDIRAFNFFMKQPMPVYATKQVQQSLKLEYHYIFEKQWYPGLPDIKFNTINILPFLIDDVEITPILAHHYKLPVFGFRINNFTYITDANKIADEEKEKIKNSEILIINALRKEKHISHFNLEEALQLIEELKPGKTYLTHISHQMGKHESIEKNLPPNVFLAYDGLEIQL